MRTPKNAQKTPPCHHLTWIRQSDSWLQCRKCGLWEFWPPDNLFLFGDCCNLSGRPELLAVRGGPKKRLSEFREVLEDYTISFGWSDPKTRFDARRIPEDYTFSFGWKGGSGKTRAMKPFG